MELYGTEGTLFVPDPNWFGGTVEVAGTRRHDQRSRPLATIRSRSPTTSRRRCTASPTTAPPVSPTWRIAILEGRDARCGLERALHGIDVMTAILKSGETGAFVDLRTTCTRPAPLDADAARALLV